MALVEDILEEQEAYLFALEKLGLFIKDILPDRELVMDSNNCPRENKEFLVADIISQTSYSGGMATQPISEQIDINGKETYIYKDKVVIDLLAYIGKPYQDLNKLRSMISNRYKHFEFFGSTKGLVGITDISFVRDNKIPVYGSQEMQKGALMRVALTYIYKIVDDYGEYIETINYKGKVKSSGDDIEEEGSVT